jgi:hypothetical protein
MSDTIYIIGVLIALLGFILFLLSETRIRIIDKEIKKQNQLHKSFMKALCQIDMGLFLLYYV